MTEQQEPETIEEVSETVPVDSDEAPPAVAQETNVASESPETMPVDEDAALPEIPSEAVSVRESGAAARPAVPHIDIRLDNAMVGRAYSATVDLGETWQSFPELSESAKQEFTELGLQLLTDPESKGLLKIEGTPLADTQGEHSILCEQSGQVQGVKNVILQLLINADPRSLWKEIEPADDLPYRKPHTASAQLQGDGYKIIAASRRGRSHAHEGTFRDDDFVIAISKSGWDIMIVADGAGSAEFSRRGSQLACETASKFLEEKTTELLGDNFESLLKDRESETGKTELRNRLYQTLCGAAFAAHKRIQQEADETGKSLKEFSTTFLCSIIRRIKDSIFVASFGIGDGAIAVYNGTNNEVELMNFPDGGEFSGQTRFLTMRELIGDGTEMMRRIKYRSFKNFTALFLMTDGISDPKFGTDNDLLEPKKWQELGEDLITVVDLSRGNKNAAVQLCEWMDFWAQGEHDDRTLAMMY